MKRWIPNQHGAWAFLVTPILYSSLVSGFHPIHLALLIYWIAIFAFNFYFSLAFKTGKVRKWLPQITTYGMGALIAGFLVISAKTNLLLLAPLLALGFFVNLYFVQNADERNLINDVVAILLSALIGYAATRLVDFQITHSYKIGLIILTGYFIGTVLYVKTMIREKGKPSWLWASYLWHCLFFILTAFQSFWLGLIGVLIFVRSILIPRIGLKPKQVGIIEFAFTLFLLVLLVMNG